MLILQALKSKNTRLLWTGQVLSSIGDEVYRVAFIWLAVSLIGPDTGFMVGTQVFAVLIVALFGGKWADHWDQYKTMFWADIVRAVLILIPVFITLTFKLSLPVLWITSIFISGIGGFFEPALQSVLPEQCKDQKTLQAATGLMSTTLRMARVTAPIIIAALATFVPTIHFFTINSLSYLISAFTLYLLVRMPKPNPQVKPKLDKHGIFKTLTHAVQTLKKQPITSRAMFLKALMAGPWWVGYALGFALLVKEKFPNNMGAFSLVMGTYGAGNLLSALIFGSFHRKHPERQLYLGFFVLAAGFLMVGSAPSLFWIAFGSFIAAMSGPLNDIPFVDMIQSHYSFHDLPKLFRLRLALETGSALIGFIAAPLLFRVFQINHVIFAVGIWFSIIGLYGLMNIEKKKT